jgi:hypothetical protein
MISKQYLAEPVTPEQTLANGRTQAMADNAKAEAASLPTRKAREAKLQEGSWKEGDSCLLGTVIHCGKALVLYPYNHSLTGQ